MIESLDAWWFPAGSGAHLGTVRILFALWLVVNLRWSRVLALAEVYRRMPVQWKGVSFYRLFPSSLCDAITRHMRVLVVAWYVSVVMMAVGLFFPLGNIAVVLLTLVLLGYDLQFGFLRHYLCLIPFVAIILACAPADPFVVWPVFELTPATAGFGWPFQLARVLLACTWCAAGVAKLRYTGLGWVFADQMAHIFKLHILNYGYEAPRDSGLAEWIAVRPRLCRVIAGASVGLELTYPLALVDWRFAAIIVPASIAMIIGIRLTMGRPMFLPLAAVTVLVWFPFDALADRGGAWMAASLLASVIAILQSLPIWYGGPDRVVTPPAYRLADAGRV